MIQIDMKMPKDCYHCPCHKHWDVNNYICGITGDTANYIGFRRDFCPLKEDNKVNEVLDRIRAEIIEKYWDCDICKYNGHFNIRGDISDILQIIDRYKSESENEE